MIDYLLFVSIINRHVLIGWWLITMMHWLVSHGDLNSFRNCWWCQDVVSLIRMVWRHSTIKKRLVHLPLPHLLLQLHPPVLEPDLDLSLSETQRVSNLNPASPGEIVVEVELLLQLQSLEPGVGLSASSPGTTIGTFDNWDITIRSVHSYWRN